MKKILYLTLLNLNVCIYSQNVIDNKFIEAAKKGNLEEVTKLIKLISKIEPDKEQHPAIINASAGGHTAIVEFLIKHGANVNFQYEGTYTPLIAAVACKQQAVAEILLKNGADPTAKTCCNRTALYWANADNLKQMIEILKNYIDKYKRFKADLIKEEIQQILSNNVLLKELREIINTYVDPDDLLKPSYIEFYKLKTIKKRKRCNT